MAYNELLPNLGPACWLFFQGIRSWRAHARLSIEPELLLALIVTAADAYQRKQPRRITRERLHMPVASEPSAAQAVK
jgi:hypothetical protein